MGAKDQNFHRNVCERLGYAEITDRVQEWEATGVTTLLLSCRGADEVRQVADVVLG